MKKSRILLAGATFLLAVTGLFATKANKRFATIKTASCIGQAGLLLKNSTALPFLTSVRTVKTAFGSIYGGSYSWSLNTMTNASGTAPVYYK